MQKGAPHYSWYFMFFITHASSSGLSPGSVSIFSSGMMCSGLGGMPLGIFGTVQSGMSAMASSMAASPPS